MINSITGRIAIAVGLGVCLATSLPSTSEAQTGLHSECKDKHSEVRLKNGTNRVIQGAVSKYNHGISGSDSWYDIQPGQTRCWWRPREQGQFVYWFKDGDNELKLQTFSGTGKTFLGGNRVRDGV